MLKALNLAPVIETNKLKVQIWWVLGEGTLRAITAVDRPDTHSAYGGN